MTARRPNPTPPAARRYGLARVLSKRGLCSRAQAAEWVRAGRVAIGESIVLDPEYPTRLDCADISIDGCRPVPQQALYLMLNKPRGLVTTTSDEHGRGTVYDCFIDATIDGMPMPWVAPVGRLDKASEGLLLLSNDPTWAAQITDPKTGPHKTYHVQINRVPDAALLAALCLGREIDGEHLRARTATLLRNGEKTAWLQIELDEGRNRHIRRLLSSFDIAVLRLIRVAIGNLTLGDLAKGRWRSLSDDEVASLA